MEDQEPLVQSIRSVQHFRNLSLRDLRTIVTSGQVQRFPAGATIFTESDPCGGMFVLIKGRVHLCKLGPQGQVNIMGVIGPVIMFNEVAVLDGGPNPLTAIAVENCLVWQIGYEAFQSLLEKIPQVGLSLLRVLARRNREMITLYEDLSFRSVVARTSKLLLDLSEHGQHPIDRHACSIEQMASRIATVPEVISRSLNVIKSSGAICVSRTEISITSHEILSGLAEVVPQLGEN
jgi:CRP/FNR family transcriptional regulator